MQVIKHRCNTLSSIEFLDPNFGAEIDIRDHDGVLILSHDPFLPHDNVIELELFLQNWKALGTLILNVKSEGLEIKCIELLVKYKISNWFFLDLSMPHFIKYSKIAFERIIKGFSGENMAVRFSDKEPIAYALNFKDRVRWVWIDWFEEIVISKSNYDELKGAGFKLCLVSPELQDKGPEFISRYREHLHKHNLVADAVCTKMPELWLH